MAQIEYRVIPNHSNYLATDDGRVWSCLRKRFLKPVITTTDNYYQVCIKRDDGKSVTRKVHHLILEAYVGFRPNGCQCRHLNGNSLDNRIANLRWGTPCENGFDRIKHGTSRKGIPLSKAHRDALKENRTGRDRSSEMVEKWKDPIYRLRVITSRVGRKRGNRS